MTSKEILVMNYALRTTGHKNDLGQLEGRIFDLADQLDALGAAKKVKACFETNSENVTTVKETDLDLTESEKKLVLKCLEMPWGLEDLETVQALKPKLQ